jgi:RHS repeat-associated protein
VTWTVGYDAAGRITSFNAPGSTATFSYDANGNRQGSVQSTANGTATNGVIRSYTVGSNSNRLLDYSQITVGPSGSVTTSASYSYNANGDLINDGKRYDYNAEGRMTSLTTGLMASSKTTRYAYNALGQRVFKTEPLLNGGTTTELASPTFVAALQAFYAQQWNPAITAEQAGWEYLYDEDGNLAAEYGTGGPDSAGSAKYMYLPTPNGPMPIVAFIDARRYAVHTDHLNTPRRLTLPSGVASWQWKYSAFGDEQPTLALNRFVNTSVNPNPGTTTTPAVTYNARYPGQYADKESGLNYNYFRTYNAETGRYTQSDPIGLEGGWNRFGYVNGNPLSLSDPEGLASNQACVAACTAGGAVAGGYFGEAAGAATGGVVGAGVGTFFFPGVGTASGGVAGAIAGVTVGGVAGATAGGTIGNIVGNLICPAEESVAMHDAANRQQRQYEAAKSRSCSPNPDPKATCSEISKTIDTLQNAIDRYKYFDAKYAPGRHDIKLKELENRVDKLKERHKDECTECK